MKTLFVSVFLDGTGYSQAGIDYASAMDAVGIDVACRTLKLNEVVVAPPERIQVLLDKASAGADVAIQHTLPHFFAYNGRLKNVGLFAWETDRLPSLWMDRCNLMDEIWVPCRQNAATCLESGVRVPVKLAPHTTDISRFQRSYGQLDFLKPYKDAGEFLIYAIGEFHRRKNFAALLKAFHLEFDRAEPVRLVLKTTGVKVSDVSGFCDSIAEGLGLKARRPEVLIADRLSSEALMSLHETCDLFCLPSYGEAWCQPAFDAMAMGKTPVVSACGGFLDYLDDSTGWLIPGRYEPCFGMPGDLYSGRQNWFSADINALRRALRSAYAEDKKREEKAALGRVRAYDYDYPVVGDLIKNLLGDSPCGAANVQEAEDRQGVQRATRAGR